MTENSIKLLKTYLEEIFLPNIEGKQNKWKDKGELYYVGGSVRDELINQLTPLKKKEIKDIDLASNLTPEDIKEICQRMNIQTIDTGLKHGTITMMIPVENERIPVEVTTFRKDIDTDGRNATIEYARTIEEDLSRRDLTFNAMSISLKTKELLDPYKGINDLKNRLIRFVGEGKERVLEDHLRLIRMVRFSFQLGFDIDKSYFNEIKTVFNINILSKERIKMEMDKIIDKLNSNNIKNFQLLFDKYFLLQEDIFNIYKHKGNKDKGTIDKLELSIADKYIDFKDEENRLMFKYHLVLNTIDQSLVKTLKFSNDEYLKLQHIQLMKEIFFHEEKTNIAIKKSLNKGIDLLLVSNYLQIIDKYEMLYDKNHSNSNIKELNKILENKEPYLKKDLDITSEEVEYHLQLNLRGNPFKKEYIGKCNIHLTNKVIQNHKLNTKKELIKEIESYLIENNLKMKSENSMEMI